MAASTGRPIFSARDFRLTCALKAIRNGFSNQRSTGFFRNCSKMNAICENKDKQDKEDQANATAWIIAPTAAVAPSRQGADQEQNEYDQKDSAHFDLTPRKWLPDNAGKS
jgi:hypothetical protein